MNGRATASEIMQAIRDRLVAELSLDATRVLLVAREDVPHFGAEADILIAAGDWRNEAGDTDGSGRHATAITRTFEITLRKRMRLDKANNDSAWLTNASRGFMAFEHAALDAIQNYYPERDVSGSTEYVTRAPLKLISGGRYDRRKRPAKAPRGWGQATIRVEARYLLDLDTSWQ